jgi:hypothetical protein
MSLGSALTGLGGALAIGYLVYSLQDPSHSFWHWPGILGLVVLCVGILMLIAGFLAPTTKPDAAETRPQIRQKQSGGRRSTNYQAGGDITIGQVDKK